MIMIMIMIFYMIVESVVLRKNICEFYLTLVKIKILIRDDADRERALAYFLREQEC